MQKIFALITVTIGVALLIYMVTVEDEPGALPLMTIIIGAVWYYFSRAKKNKPNKANN